MGKNDGAFSKVGDVEDDGCELDRLEGWLDG